MKKIIEEPYDQSKWVYDTDNNNRVRYTLGTKGENTLYVFGINPSTASPAKLDNTNRAVLRHAAMNGFDSWVTLNVYPQRATDPNEMHKRVNSSIHKKNLEHIEAIFKKGDITVWVAWGTLIEKRAYLKKNLYDIYEISKLYSVKWIQIGKPSKAGHPHHPLYLSNEARPEVFDMDGYMEKLI